jgi:predicted kinase
MWLILGRLRRSAAGGERQDGAMPRLMHLNGPPGVGKSSLARRYLAGHSLALLLDFDGIRAALGRWEVVEESKLAARTLALVMAEAHLRGSHDAVIPQYVGRMDFIAMLEDVARRCGASFIEVFIDAPAIMAVDRSRARRRELLGRGELHPQTEVPDAEIEAAVDEARVKLEAVGAALEEVIYLRAAQSYVAGARVVRCSWRVTRRTGLRRTSLSGAVAGLSLM